LTAPRSPTTTGKVERWHKTMRTEFLADHDHKHAHRGRAADRIGMVVTESWTPPVTAPTTGSAKRGGSAASRSPSSPTQRSWPAMVRSPACTRSGTTRPRNAGRSQTESAAPPPPGCAGRCRRQGQRGRPAGRALTPTPQSRALRSGAEPPTSRDDQDDHVKQVPELKCQADTGT